ncbi:MAG: hypothetical protein ACOCVF_03975 [bacterium]
MIEKFRNNKYLYYNVELIKYLMKRRKKMKYYCNDCDKYFFVYEEADEYDISSPIVVCHNCGGVDTEPVSDEPISTTF